MAHPPSEGKRQASHEEAPAGRGKKTGTAPHLSDSRLEARFWKQPPQLWLYHSCPKWRLSGKWQMWKLKVWKDMTLQKEVLASHSRRGKMSSENVILYFAWVSGQRGHVLLLGPMCGRIFTISPKASFNNSKYFKTAVKSTVIISSKIVSHEKNSFLKVHSSLHLCFYVYIYIFKK